MTPKNCLLLNCYTRTLKPISLVPNNENLGAIMGGENIEEFEVPGTAVICYHSPDVWNRLTGTIAGTKFKGWKRPYYGILVFSNLTEATSIEIQEKFETAQVRRFRFSG